jgi:hypothetical protein
MKYDIEELRVQMFSCICSELFTLNVIYNPTSLIGAESLLLHQLIYVCIKYITLH